MFPFQLFILHISSPLSKNHGQKDQLVFLEFLLKSGYYAREPQLSRDMETAGDKSTNKNEEEYFGLEGVPGEGA